VSEVNKGDVNARVDSGGHYVPLGRVKLDEHLTSLIIEVILELVDCFRQLLYGLGQ
jgi:hypothetical protein